MAGNVRMFRPRQSQATPKGRVFAVLFALAVGWLLSRAPLDSQSLTLFMVLGLIYWVFIRRHAVETTFFTRSHYLHTTMGLLLIYLLCLFFSMILAFILSTAMLIQLGLAQTILLKAIAIVSLAFQYLVIGYALIQAVLAALGRLPQFPVITRNVNSWA